MDQPVNAEVEAQVRAALEAADQYIKHNYRASRLRTLAVLLSGIAAVGTAVATVVQATYKNSWIPLALASGLAAGAAVVSTQALSFADTVEKRLLEAYMCKVAFKSFS